MACGQQKVKGGHGSNIASSSASSSASSGASSIPLNLGVGCAPSCWPIFGFRTSWVLAGGAEGSFLCSPSSRFSGRGGGVGSLPSAGRRVVVPSETSWVLAGGTEGSFLCSLITDFLAEGAGWGASPGRGGELGCQAGTAPARA